MKEHQTSTGGDGGGAVSANAKGPGSDPYDVIKTEDIPRKKSSYENYENYDSHSINGVVEPEARWRSSSRESSLEFEGYASPAGNGGQKSKAPIKRAPSIDLMDDATSSQKSLSRPVSRKNVLKPKQLAPEPAPVPQKKVTPKAPPIVPSANLYNQKQSRLQESASVREREREREKEREREREREDDEADELNSFKIEHHSYSGLKSSSREKEKNNDKQRGRDDDISESEFGANYDDEDDGYGDLMDDDDDFGGLGGLGDTGTIQRTVCLLRAHKLAIAEMVEVSTNFSFSSVEFPLHH